MQVIDASILLWGLWDTKIVQRTNKVSSRLLTSGRLNCKTWSVGSEFCFQFLFLYLFFHLFFFPRILMDVRSRAFVFRPRSLNRH